MEVPLPSSSTSTRLRSVAPRRMRAASSISARKVETPCLWESPAPMRTRMESTGVRAAEAQGT